MRFSICTTFFIRVEFVFKEIENNQTFRKITRYVLADKSQNIVIAAYVLLYVPHNMSKIVITTYNLNYMTKFLNNIHFRVISPSLIRNQQTFLFSLLFCLLCC